MAKTPKRKVARRAPKRARLSASPQQHRTDAHTFEDDAVTLLRDVDREIDHDRCDVAFARLLDGVAYTGMAEAEYKHSGGDPKALQQLAATTIRRFKKVCSFA